MEPSVDDEATVDELGVERLQQGLLTFQQDATEELLQHDGLSVFGQGLGMCTVAAALLAVHHYSSQGGGSGGAVIMIGSSPAQRQIIASELNRLAPSAAFISDVTATMVAPERIHLYCTAPNLFITTRILAVDLLTARLQHNQVAGIIVLNAHRASDDSGEGFAVRLLRAKTKTAFVRGLSDEAGQLSVGLSTMEHSMRALLVSRVSFWPRFQETVQQDLGHVDVCDMTCDLSKSMATIQEALMKVLDSMLKQVQRSHKLDSTELSLSNALTKSFDAAIRRQLDAIWNTVPQSTQAVVRDIRTVQSLLTYLLRFNCVSFLRYLQCLRAAAGPRTEWMLHSAATVVFQEAKARVYKMSRAAPAPAKAASSTTATSTTQVHPVLEEQPKWVLLRQVAEEIQLQRGLLASLSASGTETTRITAPASPNKKRARTANRSEATATETAAAGAQGTGDGTVPLEERAQHHPQGDCRGGGGASTSKGLRGKQQAAVIDLCDDDSPPACLQRGDRTAGANEGAGEDEEPYDAWIRRLTAEQLEECRDAPVLVVAREKYLVDELRSLLKERSGLVYLRELFRVYQVDRAETSGKSRNGATGANDAAVAAALCSSAQRAAKNRGGRGGGRNSGWHGGGRSGGGGRALSRKDKDKYKLHMLMNSAEEDAAIAAAVAASTATPTPPHDLSTTTTPVEPAAVSGRSAAGGSAAARGRGRGSGRGKRAAATVVVSNVATETCTKEAGSLLEGFHFLAMEENAEHVLHELRPVFVVLYDVDLTWVRLLEVYKGLYPERPLKAYMLGYEDSVELAKFQLSTSREKSAFMGLIRKKAHMVLPVDEAGNYTIVPKTAGELARGQAAIGRSQRTGNALTRRAGGHELIAVGGMPGGRGEKPKVIVDVREFMSSLPAVLYQRGIDIVPVTLEVADFVLTSDICVERKAVPDLISSLDSGRLYSQAVAMCRHYTTPVLLIEFDPKKAFALQSISDMGMEIRGSNVMSKLVILLLNFPKLRLMWARSLHATADMFLSLKGNHPQPDAEAAAQVGLDPNANQGGGIANPVARDMLLDMPGVNNTNVYKLMDAAGSLAGLARLEMTKIQEAIGTRNGRILHEFLHASYPATS